jgi:membrane-associated phospholipid phosphatase
MDKAMKSWHKSLVLLVIVSVAVMAAATVVDPYVTGALGRHQWPALSKFMARSFFKGTLPGANDGVILLLLAATAVYFLAGSWKKSRLRGLRPLAGFILTASLITAVFMVHGLKLMVGRARPNLVFEESMPYSQWFTFGSHYIFDGTFSGAFPSGHTAQAFLLMTLAYILIGDPLFPKPGKKVGWIWGGIALVFALLMGSARCMSQSHWLTDVLGSICMGWLWMHVIYFGMLRVPDQRRYLSIFGSLPKLPTAWELLLCLYILIITLGIVMTGIGMHGIFLGKPLWLTMMIPAGVALIWFAFRKARALHRTAGLVLDESRD